LTFHFVAFLLVCSELGGKTLTCGLTTAEDLQRINEASRRGERQPIADPPGQKGKSAFAASADARTPPAGRPVMIERVEIEGRMAVVSYLTEEFEPVGKDEAELLRRRRTGFCRARARGGRQ